MNYAKQMFEKLSVIELVKAAETMCRVLESVQDKGNLTKEDIAMFDAMFERFEDEYVDHAAPCYKEMEDE